MEFAQSLRRTESSLPASGNENSVSGPITKHVSFTLNLEREAVDNGSVSNGFTLDPATLAITPFNSVFKTPQRQFGSSAPSGSFS